MVVPSVSAVRVPLILAIAGVVRTGDVERTVLHDPVLVVVQVPPFTTGKVHVT